MNNNIITNIVVILTAIIGVAIIAVLVSKQSQTSSVIGAAAKGFSSILQTAISPISSSGLNLGNLDNPTFPGFMGG